jgi:thioesterase domain-containing protein
MQAVGLMPTQARADALRGPLRVFYANLAKDYRPASVYPGPVVVFKAGRGHGETEDGWEAFAGDCQRHVLEGCDHLSILKAPAARALAEYLKHYWPALGAYQTHEH